MINQILINLYLSQQFKYMFFHIFICTEISYKMEKRSPRFCLQFRNRNESTEGRKTIHVLQYLSVSVHLGPVHTNPFSNKNEAVLLRFQKDFRPHLSFSYRFRPSTLQRRSREKPHGSVCPPFWILTVEWSGAQSCLF